MAFKVAFPNGKVESYDADGARYSLNDAGVLTVLDGNGKSFTFSPSGWWCIEAAAPEESDGPSVY
ncbi:MAG TPA: hypothetical protein VNP20_17230 [Nocardioidaceae bacterium]|nr:hypothetical protein [Nocardioidaceae bacterium]